MDHIKRIFTEKTGSNSSVDFIQLKDGRIIGIDEDCAVIYSSIHDFYELETKSRQCIDFHYEG